MNYAFITRGTIPNPAFGGVLFADQFCQNEAADAGLPGTFRAWLGAPDAGNAVGRLGSARGWIRSDRRPFADTLTALATTQRFEMFYPLLLDARGAMPTLVSGNLYVYTGTQQSGSLANETCLGWSSTQSPQSARSGNAIATFGEWTSAVLLTCTPFGRFYCFGVDHSNPVRPVAPPPPFRRAFVSTAFSVDGGGPASADLHCANEAAARALPGTYRALVATSTTTAASRFSPDGGPWVRVDDVALTNSANDLLTATSGLLTTLNLTSDAGTYLGAVEVWTGAPNPNTIGSLTSTCTNWAMNGGSGTTGIAGYATSRWFSATSQSCASSARLYCLQE